MLALPHSFVIQFRLKSSAKKREAHSYQLDKMK